MYLPSQWLRVPTQWMCVLMGGGTPDERGALTDCASSFLSCIDQHSGSVCPVVVYVDGGGGSLINMGL